MFTSFYIHSILTFPNASSPLSKKNKTPKKRNVIPKPARPTPISGQKRKEKKNELKIKN